MLFSLLLFNIFPAVNVNGLVRLVEVESHQYVFVFALSECNKPTTRKECTIFGWVMHHRSSSLFFGCALHSRQLARLTRAHFIIIAVRMSDQKIIPKNGTEW